VTAAGAAAWTPYCGSAPVPSELIARWNFDPVLLAVLGFATLVLWRSSRLQQPGKSTRIAAAIAIALFLFISPFCALTSALFSARVVHHVLLAAALAPLLAFTIDRPHVPKVGPLAGWTFVQAAVFWIWHSPQLYAAALSDSATYWLMQVSLLGSSLAFWIALRRSCPTAVVGALLATMVQMGLLGALITFAGTALYTPHFSTTEAWAFSALQDQQLAGLIMWVPSAGLYLGAALFVAGRWLRAEGRLPA
jgi:putative membrane protein